MKKLRVTVEGKTYDVVVEMLDETSPPAPSYTRPAASAPVAPASVTAPAAPIPAPVDAPRGPAGAGDIVSPLAGKVFSIDVKVGDTITEGAQVATLEAMKMNTYIYASRGGKVVAVLVNPGDGVDEGAVMIKIEWIH